MNANAEAILVLEAALSVTVAIYGDSSWPASEVSVALYSQLFN